MAKLYFRYGSMNSGKSTSIIQVAHNYEEQGMKILLMKPYIDTKGGDTVKSRLGIVRKVDVLIKPEDDINDILNKNLLKEKISCILIDEAQFLQVFQVNQLFEIAVIRDIPVICYGLRTDFLMAGFPASERLLLIAHSLEELKTICKCGKKAVANARISDGKFVVKGEQVAIDEENNITYESMCGECFLRRKSEAEKNN